MKKITLRKSGEDTQYLIFFFFFVQSFNMRYSGDLR